MWRLERAPLWQPYKPWRWELFFSSHGWAAGKTWTKRGAERQMLIEQGRFFGEGSL